MKKKTQHVFYKESSPKVRYAVTCEIPMTEIKAFDGVRDWMDENAHYDPPFVPCEIKLFLATDGTLTQGNDSRD